ncbi:hypothetical protein [Fluviicola sp.]|uniref:hypothetical protein n=1 Tax=Fluviicola sp. TaxID=1917219 RepID=UPI0031DE8C4D
MCENAANITFCTCEVEPETIHNKNSRRNRGNNATEQRSYRWTLNKITGLSEQTMDGLLMEPDQAFNRELTDETILTELNDRNCFDFEYEPNEGDSLTLSEKHSGRFMSFLFENGKWRIGSPNPFTHRITTVNSGSVRFEK